MGGVYLDVLEADIQQMMKLSDREKERLIADRKKLCICGSCPSYTECAAKKRESLYCVLGKSPCFQEKIGCLCPSCQVYKQTGLKKSYYCERGSEREQRGM